MIQSPEIDTPKYGKWILMQVQRQLSGQRTVFSTSGAITLDIHVQLRQKVSEGGGNEGEKKRKNFDSYLTAHTKLKMSHKLNIKHKTINLVEENRRKIL